MSRPLLPAGSHARLDALRWLIDNAAPPSGFVRFVLGGVLNSLFGYLAFLLALGAGAPATAALVASTVAGIFFNFQTAQRVVFKSRQKGRLAAFVAVYALLFAINDVALTLLHAGGVRLWAAQALIVAPMAILAFVAQRKFVFKVGRTGP